MRKEPIIAIILGSLIGLGMAFFVWQTTKKQPSQTFPEPTSQSQKDSPTVVSSDGISIVEPLSLGVYTETSITVSGITQPNAYVAVASTEDISFVRSDDQGDFITEITVEGGYNTIHVWGFKDDSFAQADINVVYSSQIQENTTEDQRPVKNIAMLGSITDISENAIQIKTTDDLIEQLSIDEETTYANIIDSTEEIDFSEVAIGDFIIAIGTRDANTLLTQRILVSEVPVNTVLTGIYGSIDELSASEFLVTHADGKQYSIDATGKIDVTKDDENGDIVRARLSEATAGERIIIVGDLEDELIASRIHIFPSE